MAHQFGKFSLKERGSVKIQFAIEVFKRVFVWTNTFATQKVIHEEEPEEVEEHDVTSIPMGFHS